MAAPIRSEWYDISNHVPTDRNWLLRFVLEGSDRIFGLFELGDRSIESMIGIGNFFYATLTKR